MAVNETPILLMEDFDPALWTAQKVITLRGLTSENPQYMIAVLMLASTCARTYFESVH